MLGKPAITSYNTLTKYFPKDIVDKKNQALEEPCVKCSLGEAQELTGIECFV